jgi:Na+/H+ antiporter
MHASEEVVLCPFRNHVGCRFTEGPHEPRSATTIDATLPRVLDIAEISKILVLVAAVIALAEIARRTKLPYPTLMVVAGLIIGFVPELPRLELTPELVFLVFLPPILYSAAWNTWLQDFKRHVIPISSLAIGLVLVTGIVVAFVASMLIPEMPWWYGFLLGAIVSPPDAAAATAVCQRLGVSRKIVTVLEGESLVNDATGLISYRLAIAVIVAGSFSVADAAQMLFIATAGGIVVGLVAGLVIAQMHKRIRDPIVTTAISLLAPYIAYLPAEAIHVSGVLAVVTAGLYVSRRSPHLFTAQARVQAVSVWELAILLINGVLFVLIGLQLEGVLVEVRKNYSWGQLALYTSVISAAVLLVRLMWVFPSEKLARLLTPQRFRPPPISWQQTTIVGWTGMRGIISLAAAMALPKLIEAPITNIDGTAGVQSATPFLYRDLIVLITFGVIFATLVLQSLTLAPLIRLLGENVRESVEHEELVARMMTANAALAYLEKFTSEGGDSDAVTRVRASYISKLEDASLEASGEGHNITHGRHRLSDTIRRGAIAAERDAIVLLRNSGDISEEIFRRIERDLDLDESRLAE